MPPFASRLATARGWVDPHALPEYGDARTVKGNAPHDVKQLTLNTLGAYGVGAEDSFAHAAGRQIRITAMDVYRRGCCAEFGGEGEEGGKGKSKGKEKEKLEVVAVAEAQVCKEMLNGAGTVHGGCLCYLIDNCASFPLVALGVLQNTNGVGVTQAMNVFFHSPASMGTCLRITSTSVTLGGRIMTSRCEITDKASGRMIASALLGKMQPKL